MGILRNGAIQVLMAFHSSNFTGAPCHRGARERLAQQLFSIFKGLGKPLGTNVTPLTIYRNSRLISTITLAQLLSSVPQLRVVTLSVEVRKLHFDNRCSARVSTPSETAINASRTAWPACLAIIF